MKSNIFELFTHSSWVVRNYEVFWIVYLFTLWIIPDVILYLDPYALSIIPLIAILEMGYNFLNILVEILAYFFTKVLRGRRIELFFVLLGLPFLLGGLYLLFSSGSYFTFLIYLFLIVTNIKEYFASSEVEGSKIFIKDTFAAFGKLIIFFLSTLFIMVPWPELGLEEKELILEGSGLLVEFPHRGIPTGIIAFWTLWILKRKAKEQNWMSFFEKWK